MLYNAKNGSLPIDGATMDYISFGSGKHALVMIPGLGDGMKTVKGTALPFSLMYGKLAKKFKVYAFSRRSPLPDGFTTREMARDVRAAMEKAGVEKARVLGVSQGGMIAQHLAVDYPESVERLILAVTLARQNETVRRVIGAWIDMARRGDFRGIMTDTAEKSYSEKRYRKMRPMYALLGNIGKPKDFSRFITMANACLTHDAYDEIARISCPTLIIGGGEDRIVTGQASIEIAGSIPGSRLHMYDGLGHGAYEEAKDFAPRVAEFFE